jgi:hypothetical protein
MRTIGIPVVFSVFLIGNIVFVKQLKLFQKIYRNSLESLVFSH